MKQQGQALIMLLIFASAGIMLATAAVSLAIVNSQATSKLSSSESALAVAEGGVENAILRFLRDPSYTGETLPIGSGTAVVTVASSSGVTITSEGTIGTFKRKVQVNGTYTNNQFTQTSWQEVDD